MGKCDHRNCPMQFDVISSDCDLKTCPYRTENKVLEKISDLRKFVDHDLNPFHSSISADDWSDLFDLIDSVEKEYRRETNENDVRR